MIIGRENNNGPTRCGGNSQVTHPEKMRRAESCRDGVAGI